VQARRLRRKQTEIELKEMKEIVKQTKQLAHVQRDFMMEQLRRAQLDVNNSNYEDSKAKIDAVKSVMHKSKEIERPSEENSFD